MRVVDDLRATVGRDTFAQWRTELPFMRLPTPQGTFDGSPEGRRPSMPPFVGASLLVHEQADVRFRLIQTAPTSRLALYTSLMGEVVASLAHIDMLEVAQSWTQVALLPSQRIVEETIAWISPLDETQPEPVHLEVFVMQPPRWDSEIAARWIGVAGRWHDAAEPAISGEVLTQRLRARLIDALRSAPPIPRSQESWPLASHGPIPPGGPLGGLRG